MSDSHRPDNVAVHNERSLKKLAWAIEASVGHFKLFLARCNYTSLRSQLVERLQELTSVEIRILELKTSEKTLYARIQADLDSEQPDALMVFGLESVGDLDELLSATNQVREEFRKNFHFPLVLWVNDEVMEKLLRLAPDFESWATTTEFLVSTDQLIDFLKKTAEQFFDGNFKLTLEACRETKIACHELQSRQPGLDLELRASIESLLGLAEYVNKNLDAALEHYQKGLELWQKSNHVERQVKLLVDIAFCYYVKTPRYREPNHPNLQATKRYVQQYFDIVERINYPGLSANLILKIGGILRDLQEWEQLQRLAQKALQHHQAQDKLIELAKDYGFLAEVALAQERWKDARHLVNKALDVLGHIYYLRDWHSPDSLGSVYELIDVSVLLFDESRYLFILAKAQHHLSQNQLAIRNLQEAREVGTPEKDQDPCLYLDILSHLHQLYLEQKEYLEAFEIKLEQRSIEQQYGFRAFVGASWIHPQRQAKFALTQAASQETVAPEIIASGRQLDVERLIERIGRNDSKLIAIYGESGVGKSSLIYGGLVPALKQKSIGTSDVLPVAMRVYTSWVEQLGKLLAGVLEEKGIHLTAPLDSEAAILEQLQQSESRNLRTVLIFDQFEEFFFVYPNPAQRRRFFEFVGECLNILPVKVILSLRKDYLHYLLECNRLPSMKIISNDILTKNVLYELGNFSSADAKAIIQRLTDVSNFHLEPTLIDQLVQDLASNLGEVRPIELQIVGAQLQTDNITTLVEYRDRGQKEELVKRYLAEVVSDCGDENKQAAELVLYLLTDEKGTRPLKTRAEVERDLQAFAAGFKAEASRLDLVLKIFVDSGLVVLLPELPSDRYQLVHDYLAAFIRQQQEPRLNELITQLGKERKQRKISEQRLNRVVQANQILIAAQQQAKREPLEQKVGRWGLFIVVCTVIGIVSGIISLRFARFLQPWEWAAFDQFLRLRPLESIDQRIVIVGIDDEEIKKVGQWPLSDATVAKVLEKLKQQEPTAIGLDLYRDIPVEPGHQELNEVFASTPNLIGIQKVIDNSYGSAVMSPPILSKLRQVAANDIVLDTDDKVRRGLLYLKTQNQEVIASLGLKLALIDLKAKGIEPEESAINPEYLQLGKAVFVPVHQNFGGYVRTYAQGYQILMNFKEPQKSFQTISMTDVLENRIPPEILRHRIVLIGSVAIATKKSFYTPYDSGLFITPRPTFEVAIHANLASQILSAVLDGRPLMQVWPEKLEWLWIFGWSIVSASLSWWFWRLRSLQWSVFSTFLVVIGLIGVCYGAFLVGWWLPLIPPVLALVVSAIAIPLIMSNSNQLKSLRLNRTLELTIEAYSDNLADGRLAVEYFISSASRTKIAIQVLNKIAINTLDACQIPEEIAAIFNKLAWIPSTSSNPLDSVLRQFLEISQGVRITLDATSLESRQELLAQPIATLRHLQESLTSKARTHQQKALGKISERWLTILQRLGSAREI